jgi:hypothetical protein
MGYLQNSNVIVENTTKMLDEILSSTTSVMLSGMGEPVLCNWYNMNDSLSTADSGTGLADSIIGGDSPFRYNKIENLPVYNINRELQNLEMVMDDNGMMDMQVEIEPVLLPNTIIPGPYDYLEYTFGNGRNVFFRANDVKIVTAKSNGFYKVPMHLVDMDSKDYPNGIEEITVKNFKVRLDNVGSNEKCIVEDKIFDDLKELENVISRTISDYIDTFFVRKYNSFILRGFQEKFTVFDPYLTKFILKHNLLSYYDEIIQPVVMEQDEFFKSEYNKTVFRAVELHDRNKLKPVQFELNSFTKKNTNPFDYWGEEMVYLTKVYEETEMKYPTNNYMDYQYLYRMDHIEESNAVTLMENLIIRYFKRKDMDKFLSLNEIQRLKMILEPEYSDYYFYMIPIVLYILIEYKRYLNNSYS